MYIYIIGITKISRKANIKSCLQDNPQSSPEQLNTSLIIPVRLLLDNLLFSIFEILMLLCVNRGVHTEFNIIVLISLPEDCRFVEIGFKLNSSSVDSSSLFFADLSLSHSCLPVNPSVKTENGCTGTLIQGLACISFSLSILLICFNADI